MIRQFVPFGEAAAMLGTDIDGLEQGFELGLGEKIPAYIYSGSGRFLAVMRGQGIVVGTNYDSSKEWAMTLPTGALMTTINRQSVSGLGDTFGDVDGSNLAQKRTGHPVTFDLRGFFRVFPYELRRAARDGRFDMPTSVAPASWWTDDSPVHRGKVGAPLARLDLLASGDTGHMDMPEFSSLWFHVSDIDAFKAHVEPLSESVPTERALDERERASLLCIIGALAGHADLDLSQPYKAGQTVAAMLPGNVKLSARRIGDHLKAVREALDSRTT